MSIKSSSLINDDPFTLENKSARASGPPQTEQADGSGSDDAHARDGIVAPPRLLTRHARTPDLHVDLQNSMATERHYSMATRTWFAPIPYLFRPSQAGCEVHTGTRVALNAVGFFGFAKPTTVSLAKKASADTGDPDLAYFGRLKASLIEYQKTSPNVRSLGEGQKLLDKVLAELADLTPTPKYQEVHDRLVSLLRATKAAGADAQAAVAASDRAGLKKAAQRIQGIDPQFRSIVREYNRLHSTD